jgi:hypothetical protein
MKHGNNVFQSRNNSTWKSYYVQQHDWENTLFMLQISNLCVTMYLRSAYQKRVKSNLCS